MTALTPEAVGALVERLDRALAMDATTANDREWSELLAAAMDARKALQAQSRDAVIEECAKVAEDLRADDWFEVGEIVVATGKRIAAAIRSLKQTAGEA